MYFIRNSIQIMKIQSNYFSGFQMSKNKRIGLSAANAFAYALEVQIISSEGEDCLLIGIKKLSTGENEKQISPNYSSEPHITMPTK